MLTNKQEQELWGWLTFDKYEGPCGLALLIFDKVYEGFSGGRPEISLIITLLIEGGRNKEMDWIYSDSDELLSFNYYCDLIHIPPDTVRRIFERMWEYIDYVRSNPSN